MTLTLDPLDHIPPKEFVSERLRLRALQDGDGQLLYDLYSGDPDATRYMSFPCAKHPSDNDFFVKSVLGSFRGEFSGLANFCWVIELRSTGEPIGTVGIGPSKSFSLGGGYILNKRFWGHGYAAEAWGTVVNWAKGQPRVFRIEAVFDIENPASRRVMEKAGMTFEGVLRRYSIHPNLSAEPRDVGMCAWARQVKG